MKASNPKKESEGLRVVVYAGDNKILIAMSLEDNLVNESNNNLAGFAIWRTVDGKEVCLGNRITFKGAIKPGKKLTNTKWTDSDKAPFQKFRWVDVPPDGFDKEITYRVRALYFKGNGTEMMAGPECSVPVKPAKVLHTHFRPAFTRGYIASQAYADKFKNRAIRPNGAKTPDFDTKPYQEQYEWLGGDAREELFAFITDCERDSSCRVDVFAYDLDEPDVVGAICNLGKIKPKGRVRAILDDATLHSKKDPKTGKIPPEIKAAKLVKAALETDNVRQGHFGRYQHNKVFIKRDAAGRGQKVIFGSMNFSVRGLYVQANNVIVVEDARVAQYFADAFDIAFKGNVRAPAFRAQFPQRYLPGSSSDTAALPIFSLALSPHTDAKISLGPMTDRIRNAKSSVFFAVMEPKGKGTVLNSLRQIAAAPTIFSYGTVETDKGLAVQDPKGALGMVTSYAALIKQVPPPFTKEFSDAGGGKHIHDKFVVVDFNAEDPTVFSGSSNLASGGEHDNGDSLAMIQDAAIANMYAIEAVALFDHYHYRKKVRESTKVQPLTLWYPGKPGMPVPWWKGYYDNANIKLRDRCLFADVSLPPGLQAIKTPDWSALDKKAETEGKKGTAKKAAKRPTKKSAKKPVKKTSKKAAKKK